MFDRLLEVLFRIFDWLLPFTVIDDFERAVVLRLGQFHRELEPGFHWMLPLGAERILKDNVVPRTINLKAQSLTTKDGKSVVIAAVVTARIKDVRKAVLEVETVDNVLEDSCYGQVGAHVAATEWGNLHAEEFSEALTAACRKNAFKFGVEIMKVQLSDIAPARAIRLYQAGG